MKGNFHVRFFEGGGLATARFHSAQASGYPSTRRRLRAGTRKIAQENLLKILANISLGGKLPDPKSPGTNPVGAQFVGDP
jgi:hypothetical protein